MEIYKGSKPFIGLVNPLFKIQKKKNAIIGYFFFLTINKNILKYEELSKLKQSGDSNIIGCFLIVQFLVVVFFFVLFFGGLICFRRRNFFKLFW